MFTRIIAPVLLVLFLVSGLATPLLADDDKTLVPGMARSVERMHIAAEVEAKAPAETVADLPAPPDSEVVTLADLPEEAAETMAMAYAYEEGDLIYTSTATPGVIQNFFADELAKRGYSCYLLFDEEGKPISPAFTYGGEMGTIRVVADDTSIPGKTLVAVIVAY